MGTSITLHQPCEECDQAKLESMLILLQ